METRSSRSTSVYSGRPQHEALRITAGLVGQTLSRSGLGGPDLAWEMGDAGHRCGKAILIARHSKLWAILHSQGTRANLRVAVGC